MSLFSSKGVSLINFMVVGILFQMPSTTEAESADLILEEEIRRSLFANYSVFQRPVNSSSNTVTIQLAFSFVAMLQLVERDQVLSSSSWLQLRWIDPRLTWNPEDYGGVDLIPINPTEVWLPKLVLFNAMDSNYLIDEETGQIILQSDGEINLGTPIRIATLCPLDVTYFPFDTQICPFYFALQNLPTQFAKLEAFNAALIPYDTSTQWNTTAVTGFTNYTLFPNPTSKIQATNASLVTFCVHFKRIGKYYLLTLLIPSSCLTILAYMTFLAPIDSGERISLTVSMVLGLAVFQLLMSDLLPITNQPPILAVYLFTNFLCVAITIPMSMKNMNYAYGDAKKTHLKSKWVRLLFLEYLPWLVWAPTLSQRVTKRRKKSSVTPLQPSMIIQTAVEAFGDENKNGKLEPDEPVVTKEEEVLEARTIAIVSDRLSFLMLFVAQIIRTVLMMLEFNRQEEVDSTCHLF